MSKTWSKLRTSLKMTAFRCSAACGWWFNVLISNMTII